MSQASSTRAHSANAAHGLQRKPLDYRRAYEIACRNGLVEAIDSEAVAALLRCSGRWGTELTEPARAAAKAERDAVIIAAKEAGDSNREVARKVGVGETTVREVAARKRNTSESAHPSSEPAEPPAWKQQLDELATPQARAWSAALRALREINQQASVNELFAERFAGFDHVATHGCVSGRGGTLGHVGDWRLMEPRRALRRARRDRHCDGLDGCDACDLPRGGARRGAVAAEHAGLEAEIDALSQQIRDIEANANWRGWMDLRDGSGTPARLQAYAADLVSMLAGTGSGTTKSMPAAGFTLLLAGPSRHWGIMPLWQKSGLRWRSGQIDAQPRHRACRCRLRSGPGAADRRHLATIASAETCSCVGSPGSSPCLR